MIDTKGTYLPQKGFWRSLGEVLSFSCAGDPRQRYLWGILGAQVIDRRGGHLREGGVWWALRRA